MLQLVSLTLIQCTLVAWREYIDESVTISVLKLLQMPHKIVLDTQLKVDKYNVSNRCACTRSPG